MKYIDAEKLYKQVDELMAHFAKAEKEARPDDEDLSIYYQGKVKMCSELLDIINSLQQEKQMPDSTQLIEEWENTKSMLEGKDFRNDSWRLAYNAFLEGFAMGCAQKEQEQPDVNFKVKERKWVHDAVDSVFPEDGDFMSEFDFRKILKETARHFYELGLKARKGEQEQQEVDLENEAVAFCFDNGINVTPHQATRFAHHFYELGLKVRK